MRSLKLCLGTSVWSSQGISLWKGLLNIWMFREVEVVEYLWRCSRNDWMCHGFTDKVVICQISDLMNSEAFSNLCDPVIPWFYDSMILKALKLSLIKIKARYGNTVWLIKKKRLSNLLENVVGISEDRRDVLKLQEANVCLKN